MADGASIDMPGLDQMLAEMRALPDRVVTKVLKDVCATGAAVIRREVVARAPEWTEAVSIGHPPGGTLKRAVYQARMSNLCSSTAEVWMVGIRKGKRFRNMGKKSGKYGPTQGTNRDAFYASWIEFGHYTRVPLAMTKTAKAAGRALGVAHYVAPHPFFRPAFETKKVEALNAMQQKFSVSLLFATESFRYLKAA